MTHPSNPDPESVKRFYDEFNVRRMSRYLETRNPRIEKAITRILAYVRPATRALDIGCGIGLVAEQIAAAAPQGRVWGCDISGKNVETARDRGRAGNVEFRTADAVRDFETLRTWIGGTVDLVVLVDVLEHIPLDAQPSLLANLRSVMSAEGVLVLTYPSPAYQDYLRREKPEELQIVDETIQPVHLAGLAADNHLELKLYSLEDVWLPRQYVHCVLTVPQTFRGVGVVGPGDLAAQDLLDLVKPSETIVVVDEEQWRGSLPKPLKTIPFLEKGGVYQGPPPDDATAIRELERMREEGALWMAFAAPSFWWLDHYIGLSQHLSTTASCELRNERWIVFSLRGVRS